MTLPKISVVITTYNYGRFVEEAIESALSQQYPAEKREVIVVDDGSTDDTPERVKKYGGAIRYLRQANGGQASALNLGFANATGEIVSLLDADDYFLPGKLTLVASAFRDHPGLGMFYHPFLEFDMETGESRVSQFPPLISGSPFEDWRKFIGWAGPGTCVSFRREFLDRLLPVPEEIRMIADDYLGSLIIFIAPVQAVPECLSGYRFHGSNEYHADETQISMEARRKKLQLFYTAHQAMRRWLEKNGFSRKQLPVRVFVDWWSLYLESQEFLIEPPGRLRFFWWSVRKNHADRDAQTWRFTLIKYVTALSALVFGYARANRMYQWRDAATGAASRVYRFFVNRSPTN